MSVPEKDIYDFELPDPDADLTEEEKEAKKKKLAKIRLHKANTDSTCVACEG